MTSNAAILFAKMHFDDARNSIPNKIISIKGKLNNLFFFSSIKLLGDKCC